MCNSRCFHNVPAFTTPETVCKAVGADVALEQKVLKTFCDQCQSRSHSSENVMTSRAKFDECLLSVFLGQLTCFKQSSWVTADEETLSDLEKLSDLPKIRR